MAKVQDYDVRRVPQEQVDFNDDVRTILNNGKVQMTVVTSAPSWRGRRGEQVIIIAGNSGSFVVCTSDLSTSDWSIVSTFST